MSNYTKATNFATKDALVTGNPLKTLSGTELDDEFNSIATAITTKANTSNTELTGTPTAPTAATATNSTQLATTAYVQAQKASTALTGTPTAPTATVGTNTTQLATTAFVTAATPTAATINALAYPVGSVYTSVVSTNPATLLGVGTWVAFGAGRVLLGDGGGYSAGATGGATTDSHSLSIAEMPAHTHTDTGWNRGGVLSGSNEPATAYQEGTSYTITSNATGGGNAHTHDIMQPYVVVYFWKRTV
jgi:hypothetical protein